MERLKVYWVSHLFSKASFMCYNLKSLLDYIEKDIPLQAFEAQSGEIIEIGNIELEDSVLTAITPKGIDRKNLVVRLDALKY